MEIKEMKDYYAAGNIVEQKFDGNKTVNAGELALEMASDKLPIPKVKTPKLKEVTDNVITAAEAKVKRAKNIAGNNPRPSRAEAVKEAKKNVYKQKAKQKTVNNANKVG